MFNLIWTNRADVITVETYTKSIKLDSKYENDTQQPKFNG